MTKRPQSTKRVLPEKYPLQRSQLYSKILFLQLNVSSPEKWPIYRTAKPQEGHWTQLKWNKPPLGSSVLGDHQLIPGHQTLPTTNLLHNKIACLGQPLFALPRRMVSQDRF